VLVSSADAHTVKRSKFWIIVLGMCAACAAPDPGVTATRSDPLPSLPDALLPTSSVVPATADDVEFDAPEAISFPIETSQSFGAIPDLGAWPLPPAAEATIHALSPTATGWLAVGNTTSPLGRGIGAVWQVDSDSTFGEPLLISSQYGDTSTVARDAVTVGATTFIVGHEGVGRDALPMVWRLDEGVITSSTILPTQAGTLVGAVTDRIVVLADGTLVVVGRGDGPSYGLLSIWKSGDGGMTWTGDVPGLEAFLPPIVATDGSSVAMLLRTYPGEDGLAGYQSAVFSFDEDGVRADYWNYIDPTPGELYWPQTLVWDGSQFAAGLMTEGSSLLATSSDGKSYDVVPLVLPETIDQSAVIRGMVMVGGNLVVFAGLGQEIMAFERQADGLVQIPLPYVTHSNLAYLEGRDLFATDGVRVAYLAATYKSMSLLSFDGAEWSAREPTEVPVFRNLERFELGELAGNGDSKLAILNHSVAEEPGVFTQYPFGVIWQRPGQLDWTQVLSTDANLQPVAIEAWHDGFLIADVDFDAMVTTLWFFDPTARDLTEVASIAGKVEDLVSGASGLLAVSLSLDGSTVPSRTLWSSVDGDDWYEVVVAGAVTGVCTDGEAMAAVWTVAEGESDVLGLLNMDGLLPTPLGQPLTTTAFQIRSQSRDVGICAVGTKSVLAMHVGSENAVGRPNALSRHVLWEDGPGNFDRSLVSVAPDGSTETAVNDVAWTDTGWVAVGHGRDLEASMDAMIWRSDDGYSWDPGEVIAGGPGNQAANNVFVDDGQLAQAVR
jgi:hypothetical protein